MRPRKGPVGNFLNEDQKIKAKEKIIKKSEKFGECWNYIGYGGKLGYVLTTFDGKWVKAHRLSYMAFKGEIPINLQICHTCDNRICVNPEHLYLGTPKDNARDRGLRGRKACTLGSKNGASKLSEEQVIEIKKMLNIGKSLPEIAKLFNARRENIWCIKKGISWSHINVVT